jgi:hypothetical protein
MATVLQGLQQKGEVLARVNEVYWSLSIFSLPGKHSALEATARPGRAAHCRVLLGAGADSPSQGPPQPGVGYRLPPLTADLTIQQIVPFIDGVSHVARFFPFRPPSLQGTWPLFLVASRLALILLGSACWPRSSLAY